jgi:predicted ABC-type ATPase
MYARNVYAKSLQDVSNLRYQAVFMMGTAGSGKTYVSHKWMKFMPGGGASGYENKKEWEKAVEDKHLTEQERGLSNLNFEAVKDKLEALGFRIDLVDASHVSVPFRMSYELDGKEYIVDPDDWDTEHLPDSVVQSLEAAGPDIKNLKDVVFGTPKHELPTYWRQVNPDLYKEELAGYAKKSPGYVHEMSSEMSKAYFEGILASGDPLMVDGTGANQRKMAKWIAAAKDAGYKVSLVYVYVPLTIAMIRNATRGRSVSAGHLIPMFAAITKNYAQLRGSVDKAHFIDNRNDSVDIGKYKNQSEKINAHVQATSKYSSLYDLIKAEAPKELREYGWLLKGAEDDSASKTPRQREIDRMRKEKGITRRYAAQYDSLSMPDLYTATVRLAGFEPLRGELFWPAGSLD